MVQALTKVGEDQKFTPSLLKNDMIILYLM